MKGCYYRITTNTGREKTGLPHDAIGCTQSMLLRMESGKERGNATET